MRNTLIIKGDGIRVSFDTQTFISEVDVGYKVWAQYKGFSPYLEVKIKDQYFKLYFKDANNIKHTQWQKGFGQGIKSSFTQFTVNGEKLPLAFETLLWIDNTFNNLHFEVIPIMDGQGYIRKIVWPGPFVIPELKSSYTVIPRMQGVILPGDFPEQVEMRSKGMYYSRDLYMPWWGQIDGGSGYIAIAQTPWDGGCDFRHPAGGPTSISPVWYSSLGELRYNRKISYSFLENCDYNDLCKVYRIYLKQKGELITLEEKIARNPNVNRLLGTPIVHSFIYYHIKPASVYYNLDDPKENDKLVSFKERSVQLGNLKALGVNRLYLHLDGWGKRGYDNLHPDILPPCELAGGWEGMKKLSDTCKDLGYIFATHDQYWDYYKDAETFDPEQAIHDESGHIRELCMWYGGEQAFMCGHFMIYYINRNFKLLKKHDIELEGTYLDCLSVADLDECFHAEHILTRKQCAEERRKCLEYVGSQNIISSSEEPIDWAIPSMDMVHHAPYSLDNNIKGIPVPLLNLVYHDCIIIPWSITDSATGIPDNCFLHALLNGGVPYLDIEADEEEIKKSKLVCELHKQVGKSEMLKHEFVNGNFRKQKVTFANGVAVNVDFDTNSYFIQQL
ncbi:MAG: hypothetical protein FIA99_07040 [Ruminiclostridium sp.]|nr:hypothetical protein [Ruminiclostridium sp.]